MTRAGGSRQWPPQLAGYAIVLRAFIEGRMTGNEFETLFLSVEDDDNVHPRAVFGVLEGLFGHVDDYCPDDDIRRDVGGIDQEELRGAAREAFDELGRALADKTGAKR